MGLRAGMSPDRCRCGRAGVGSGVAVSGATVSQPRKRTVLLASLAAVTGVALALILLSRGGHSATASGLVPAAQGMSAVTDADTVVSGLPPVVKRLSVDIIPSPGSVHELMSNVGTSGFSLYAWRGEGESVCYVSTRAGGGCFAKFLGPFNVSITDFDRLGSGAPVTVSGPVRDDVVGIDIVAGGNTYHALVRGNVAFFELPDATALPAEIEKITARLRDGTTEDVRL